jgi:LmbE family N-acetylglucosaminyl deacetylase
MVRKFTFLLSGILFFLLAESQQPPVYTSAEIFLQLKKLKVLGSVLYVGAHPDDENTRLLAWLAKERLYRTGYLSLTRGDGGQNLIGDEQGIDLGLIRTQELLAARRIDGAEQFFSRAFDFGFSKNTEEAFRIWGKDKILSDVVWVIRKFQPDVIITRFPEDSRAGHGHHSGSSVLAHEAFRLAADSTKFPEQLKLGVRPWQAKRIFWNSFNFGGTNTTSEDQLKTDVGGYNAILGKSYGEIAAESRSQHKSQGFGVASSRGAQLEYFSFTEGSPAKNDIFEDVNTGWSRVEGGAKIDSLIDDLIKNYSLSNPELSVPALVNLYKELGKLKEGYWKIQKAQDIQKLVEAASGIWAEASTNTAFAVQGDSLRLMLTVNNRLGSPMSLRRLHMDGLDSTLNIPLEKNKNFSLLRTVFVPSAKPLTQPYWLVEKMGAGSFNVNDQQLIGRAENSPSYEIEFSIAIGGQDFVIKRPLRYKFTDPVKGELFQPLAVVPAATVSTEPSVVIFRKDEKREENINILLTANRKLENYSARISKRLTNSNTTKTEASLTLAKGEARSFAFPVNNTMLGKLDQDHVQAFTELKKTGEEITPWLTIAGIQYDHIPNIYYFYQDNVKVLNIDLKTVGKKVGYIEGAGDKVTVALQQMGYDITIIKEKDITATYLKQFDAIITGVRAYNVHPYLAERNEVLMDYVKNGGNLIVQYNTNSFVGPIQTRIGPYSFNISRNRVTDETAKVSFLLPDHPVLNYPNKITQKDFEGWVQERGIYFAEQADPHYEMPLSMADPGEQAQNGSLIIADYGKGKFVYTGLVFFRELPAGVPGAYRLLANLIALSKKRAF